MAAHYDGGKAVYAHYDLDMGLIGISGASLPLAWDRVVETADKVERMFGVTGWGEYTALYRVTHSLVDDYLYYLINEGL